METKTPTPTLPDKAYQLIRLAIEDFKLAQQDPNVVIDMADYHYLKPVYDETTGHYRDKCAVCLAGAVMRHTLQLDDNNEDHPETLYPDDTSDKLYALNQFRLGNLRYTLRAHFHYNGDHLTALGVPVEYTVSPYSTQSDNFLKDLCGLACYLEKLNL